MSKRTLQIPIPALLIIVSVACCAIGAVYWYQAIYPFYQIKKAFVYAPTREIRTDEVGVLSELTLDEGAVFQKGATLFSLMQSMDEGRLHQLDEKIHGQKQQISQIKTELEETMEQYLYLQKEVGASEVVNEILAAAQGWQEKETQANRELTLLEAERAAMKKTPEMTVAPFDGVVLKQLFHPGEKIKAGDPVLLLGRKELSIEAEIPESMLSLVALDQPAWVKLPSYPGKTWQGRICWISPVASDGQIKIRITADNLPFKMGLQADVSLKIR